jgi:hypothetical protein
MSEAERSALLSAAALIGAGVLSVLLFPLPALSLRKADSPLAHDRSPA